jgi:hypothetical protein
MFDDSEIGSFIGAFGDLPAADKTLNKLPPTTADADQSFSEAIAEALPPVRNSYDADRTGLA